MRRFFLRVWNALRPSRGEAGLVRELEAHLSLVRDEYERRGLPPHEAYRLARIALGGIEQTKELHRDARTFVWLGDVRQDVIHAWRLLWRSPVFTVTASASLAIGIGANTAIFSVANALLFRAPDGVTDPRSLIEIGTLRGDGGLNPMPYRSYLEIASRSTTLSGVFARNMFPRAIAWSGPAAALTERAFGQYVSTDFFTVLGVNPAVGRVFNRADGDARRPASVVVLSHAFWTERCSQDPALIGRIVRINGRPFTVVGVARAGFQGTGIESPDMWLPLGTNGSSPGSLIGGGRVKPGVSVAEAAAELRAIGDAIAGDERRAEPGRPVLHALPASRAGGNRNVILGFAGALMIVVSLVLAVACANVAGIVMARSTARAKEMALRTALGARRGRLMRQLLTETMMLFLLGGALGLALAKMMVLIGPVLPVLPMPVAISPSLDTRVIAFTAFLSLIAALASGLGPAFTNSNTNPVLGLKESPGSGVSSSRLRSVFVVAQVALSVLLVVLAALFVRALRHAGAMDPGFEPSGVEIASLDLSMGAYNESTRSQFWRDLVERVRRLPDVETATLARVPPGGFEGIGLGGFAPAERASSVETFSPAWNIVDARYFATLGIPLIAGHDFSDADVAGVQPVVIVSERIARRYWPDGDAVGKAVTVPMLGRQGPSATRSALVVGVVRDIKSSSLIDGLAESYVYLPLQQNDASVMTTEMTVVARARQGRSVIAGIRRVVNDLDQSLAIVKWETLEDSLALGLAPQRILAAVAGSLGVIGLLLAALGIYGVTAFTVARRSHELGVRLALGAQRHEIMRLVLKHGIVLAGAGAVIGLGLAAAASQVVSVFLYGLPPLHLPTFLGTLILFALVGLIASYIPARRVTRLDPWQSLRSE
jgi:putative ABC transport system permease protein